MFVNLTRRYFGRLTSPRIKVSARWLQLNLRTERERIKEGRVIYCFGFVHVLTDE